MSKHPYVSRERVMRLLRRLVNCLVNLEVEGGKHIPDTGGYVLATSHISRLDTPFLMLSTSRKDVVGMVARDYEKAPFFGWFLNKLGVIWISRTGYDFQAFREASSYLKSGGVVGLAPEGTRSADGKLLEGKPGAALLAMKNKVKVIPAAVLGSADMMKHFMKFTRMQVKVIFGQPFELPHLDEAGSEKDILEQATTEIMVRIAMLLPEERRGMYADHPRLRVLLESQGLSE
jgi:1-acyl-sn-glycerol-3-phosphate acyltransferase